MISDLNTLQYLNVNQSAIEHFGYSKDEFLEMTILDIRPKEEHQKVLSYISNLGPEIMSNAGNFIYVKKNGEGVLTEVSVTQITYKGKRALLGNCE